MPLQKVGKDTSILLAGRSVDEVIKEYADLSEKIGLLEKRKTSLADTIKKLAVANGSLDDKGSYYAEAGNLMYGRVARKKSEIDQVKAEEFFKSKGMWSKVSNRVLDEKKVDQLLNTGELTAEDIENIIIVNETYSVSVSKKKVENTEMPEIEVSNEVREKGVRKLFKVRGR